MAIDPLPLRDWIRIWTLMMLETEYSGFFFCQYHACWCPGSQSHQDSRRHDIDSIGWLTCRVASWWIWIFLLNKSQDMIWHVITAFMTFKKQFSMLRVKYESLTLQFSSALFCPLRLHYKEHLKVGSTLVRIVAWCHQATGHDLTQGWQNFSPRHHTAPL